MGQGWALQTAFFLCALCRG